MTPAHSISALAQKVAVTWGMPHLAAMVEVQTDKDSIHIYLASEEIVSRSLSVVIDDDLVNDICEGGPRGLDLRTRFSEMIRLEARASQMPHHDRLRPPPWSLSLPRLFRDMLDLHGMSAQDMVDALDTYSGWEAASLPSSANAELSSVMIQSGRMTGSLVLSGGVMPVSILSRNDEDGACTVILHDMDLPETMLTTLPGLPLAEIVEHADLDASQDHVVRQVVRRLSGVSREIHLLLEPDHVWGGDVPDGVDASWRSIREGRRLPIG